MEKWGLECGLLVLKLVCRGVVAEEWQCVLRWEWELWVGAHEVQEWEREGRVKQWDVRVVEISGNKDGCWVAGT